MKFIYFLLFYFFLIVICDLFDPFVFISLLIIVMTIQVMLCFKDNKRLYFLIFPIISILLSFFFKQNYSSIGDGVYYFEQANKVYDLLFIEKNFFSSNSFYSIFYELRYIGAYPQILFLKELFISNISESAFYLSQQLFFLALILILIKVNALLKVLKNSTMLYIVLFLLISPTFFVQGVAPTRHYFTFFAVFLYYLSIEAVIKKNNFLSLFILMLAIIFTFLSKGGYIVLYLCYFFLRIFYSNSPKKFKYFFYFFIAFLPFYFYYIDFFNAYFFPSDDQIYSAGTTFKFSGLLGLFYKIILTSFGNFPWYDFKIHYNNFGGNIVMFFFHILSVFTWFLIVLELFFMKNKLSFLKKNENSIILFGLIMILSILFGKAGHHGYLSIFFPFLFLICSKKTNRFIPFVLIGCFMLNLFHAFIF